MLCDKNETSAMLEPSALSEGKWKDCEITKWGKIVKKCLKDNY